MTRQCGMVFSTHISLPGPPHSLLPHSPLLGYRRRQTAGFWKVQEEVLLCDRHIHTPLQSIRFPLNPSPVTVLSLGRGWSRQGVMVLRTHMSLPWATKKPRPALSPYIPQTTSLGVAGRGRKNGSRQWAVVLCTHTITALAHKCTLTPSPLRSP